MEFVPFLLAACGTISLNCTRLPAPIAPCSEAARRSRNGTSTATTTLTWRWLGRKVSPKELRCLIRRFGTRLTVSRKANQGQFDAFYAGRLFIQVVMPRCRQASLFAAGNKVTVSLVCQAVIDTQEAFENAVERAAAVSSRCATGSKPVAAWVITHKARARQIRIGIYIGRCEPAIYLWLGLGERGLRTVDAPIRSTNGRTHPLQ